MSLNALLMRELVRFTAKRRLRNSADVAALRAELERLEARKPQVEYAYDISTLDFGGVEVERVAPLDRPDPGEDEEALLYFHGGAWVVGEPRGFRPLTTRLVEAAGAPLYGVDYRLAPEHPYPCALDDCERAYRTLLDRGLDPRRIALIGDSAGGNLVFALALRLKRQGIALPAALVGLSPCTDLTAGGGSFKRNFRRDAMLPAERLNDCIEAYCPCVDLCDPEVSPLFGDLTGLPPTMLQVSDNEILLDDSTRLAARLREAGCEVELDVWKGLWHVWQAFPEQVPEARRAIVQIGAFVRQRFDARAERVA